MDGGAARLDPGAEEFRPKTSSTPQNQFALVQPQIYYTYHSSYHSAGMQALPFYDGSPGYRFSSVTATAEAYVSQPPRPPLPCTGATRTLLLSSVPTHLTEPAARRELEAFGDVRAVQMGRLGQEGIVTVHFYDLRDAQRALVEIQEQHMRQQSRLGHQYSRLMRSLGSGMEDFSASDYSPPAGRGLLGGRAVWAQFAVPKTEGPDTHNQGTIVVFNLDSEVSASDLKSIFEPFGPVKELRETPYKRQHRFVEFFDVRDAARALSEMNGKLVCGRRLMIEFSRPGGQARRPFNTTAASSSSSARNKSFYNQRDSNFPAVQPPALPPRAQVRPPDPSNSLQVPEPNIYSRMKPIRRHEERGIKKMSSGSSSQSGQWRQSNGGGQSSRIRKKKLDRNFLFMEESDPSDSRTTVMIKNIPNKYSQKLFLNMLDNHCIHCNEQIAERDEDVPFSSYDFVYLPIDFNNKCNVGYGFVNLTSPEAAWRLYKSFHKQPWEVFNSRKICEVTYARLQGLEALKEHFKNSKFACETDEYLPVEFSPPRDGKQLTEPETICGRAAGGVVRKIISRTDSGSRETEGGDSFLTSEKSDVEDEEGGGSTGSEEEAEEIEESHLSEEEEEEEEDEEEDQ